MNEIQLNVNDFDLYRTSTDKLWHQFFDDKSPIRKSISRIKDGISILSLTDGCRLAWRENIIHGVGSREDKLYASILTDLRNNLTDLRNNFQKVSFNIFSITGSKKDKMQKYIFEKMLISNTEESLKFVEKLKFTSNTNTEEMLKLLRTNNVSKFLGRLGILSTAFDGLDLVVKARQGDVWGAFYSAELVAGGTAGSLAFWFPKVAKVGPIGTAATLADLFNEHVMKPFVYDPGDNFQEIADYSILYIYDIHFATVRKCNSILKSGEFTISDKILLINALLEGQNKLINGVTTDVEASFKKVILKSWIEGSYTAFKDAKSNIYNTTIRLSQKVQLMKLLIRY